MKFRNFLAYSLVLSLGLGGLSAKEKPHANNNKKSALQALAEGCAPATAQTDLNINNVRARILGGGDMWWDLNDAQYEVPKGSNKHSMFAGALWLGGYDDADQLKLAAMTYRQDGVDYWPGPLDDNASITEETCQEYDQHWTVYRSEVETHKAWIDCKEDPACDPEARFPGYAGNIPQSIIEWPGNGIRGSLPYKLAPYEESDTNGIPGFYEYEWDYPGYDFTREADCQDKEVDLLYGDQTIWWVYNDKGNIHTETNAAALGFEIRAQAFAFTANDEVNNMTFNNYRIINRSTFRLRDTYFGTWFDADLGNPYDDIIGSDIARGLGYVYNGDNDDEGALGYGANPPAVGFDFFQGPFADYFDGQDNDRDGCVDGVRIDGICVGEDPTIGLNERIIMSGFMYYNNSSNFNGPAGTTDPNTAQEFYNLLNSIWKDGRPLVIESPAGKGNTGNGDGYNTNDPSLIQTRFAYPGNSFDTTFAYEPFSDQNWFESPNNQADKRGLHCAGPFSLAPGALNFITTGAVWARNFSSQDLFASVNDVIVADDKAQQLFDNCFQVLDGPNAPDIEIVELDRELLINLIDPFNASTIGYVQKDPRIPPDPNWTATQIDSADRANYFNYLFEGFQVFQVSNADVGVDELYDVSQSRLIAQSDLRNGITQLVNYFESPDLIGNPLMPQDMTLAAEDNGIKLSYRVLEDAFAEGDRGLINHKEYYFYVLAYAQNDYKTFVPGVAGDNSNAQKTPYLAGRRNIGQNSKPYLGIPSKTESRNNGTTLNAEWGDLVQITRVAGKGNGSSYLRVSTETEEAILAAGASQRVTYNAGFAPIEVKVIDPYKIGDGTYQLRFTDVNTTRSWELIDVRTDSVIAESEQGIDYTAEQIITDEITKKTLGFSITINDAVAPGLEREGSIANGVIGGSITYEDPTKQWFSGLPDSDANNPTNWILAGANDIQDDQNLPAWYYNDYTAGDNNVDPFGEFENVLGGTWAPVSLASNVPLAGTGGTPSSPGYPLRDGNNFNVMYPIQDLPNIDVVISPDPEKWSRVPVLEMGNFASANEGGAATFRLRSDASLNKVGNQLFPDLTSTGWSYFPGYAYNVETGKRLNLVIGENSWLKSENGDDMLWNPTANVQPKLGGLAQGSQYVLGGMHVLYVLADSAVVDNQMLDLTYQGDAIEDYPLKSAMENMNRAIIRSSVWGAMTWCTIGMVSGNQFAFDSYDQIPTEVKIEVRVQSPFAKSSDAENDGNPLYEFSMDGFQSVTNDLSVANSALDQIRVVPNPYYGSSGYEDGQLDNIVKITNLPPRCEINIFMPNGTLVRTINKDNTLTYTEWDLKNEFNVPIASGIYLIHIDAGAAGQKVVKWMGSLRPVDLNAF